MSLSDISYIEPTVDAINATSRATWFLRAAACLALVGAAVLPSWRTGVALTVPPVLAVAADATFHNSLMPHAAVVLWFVVLLVVLATQASARARGSA